MQWQNSAKSAENQDDPGAVRVIEEAIAAIPQEHGRNQPTYEAGLKLGSRRDQLSPRTYAQFVEQIRSRAGPTNAEALQNGVANGERNAGGAVPAARPQQVARAKDKTTAGHRDARRAIAEAVDVAGTLGERYLREVRGVELPAGSIAHFHQALPDFTARGPSRPKHPALVFPFVNAATGEEIDAVGVIYLRQDGTKAAEIATKGKLCRGERKQTGAAVILGDLAESDTVIVAEGPETALSGANATGFPALATWGLGFASIALPGHVKRAIVLADHRARDAADKQILKLKAQHPHVEVLVVRTPDEKVDDFNDLLRAEGLPAVRRVIDQAVVDADKKATPRASPHIDWPDVAKGGIPVPKSQPNIRAFLSAHGICLRYDTFADRYEMNEGHGWREIDDAAMNRIWLAADAAGLKPSIDYFIAVITNEARLLNTVHPVRDYLRGLAWDGKPRLDTWLATYLGAADTPLTRAFGRLWMVGAVRRVVEPGAKFDYALILEGPQGRGKSSALAILGGAWFSDNLQIGSNAKEIIELTGGVWIAELAELNGLRRREVEAVKAFLSRQSDRARLAWGRTTTDRRRQFVLAGTVNGSEYLRDETGNRRFWPVNVGEIDLVRLRADRDQLWAEAAELEARGASIALDRDLWEQAGTEQAARVLVDPWVELLQPVLEGRVGHIATETIWNRLSINADRRDGNVGQRVAAVMRRFGFERTQIRRNGRRQYAYSSVPAGSTGIWLDDDVRHE